MKNYILMLGVAGVALGSYVAYAGNSATMTVTATIAHDVNLSVTRNISWTMTIDPSQTSGEIDWLGDIDGCEVENNGDGIISASMTPGRFTANIPNLANYLNVLSFEEYGDYDITVNSNEYGNKFSIQLVIDHVSGYEFAVTGFLHYSDVVPAAQQEYVHDLSS